MRVTNKEAENIKTLYITDLDGTLLRSDSRISAYSLHIINNLIKSGVMFSYATARSLSSAQVVTVGLELQSPVIIYNGVFIIDTQTGEKILRSSFTSDEIKAVSDFMNTNDIYPLVYSFVNGVERVSWLSGKENNGMCHYLNNKKGDKRLREVFDTDSLYTGDVFYFTCIGEQSKLEPVYNRFVKQKPYTAILQQELYRPEYWCEIMPKKATKANAISQLKKILNCGRVISFGDGKNDVPMFEISDECYAVENAVPELKAIATGIVDTNGKDGVAKWLKKNVL